MALNGKRSLHSLNGKCAQQTFLARSREMWYIAKERPSNYKPKTHFKEVVATLSKKNEMGAYTRYVTISFFEDKEANAPYKCVLLL